MSDFSSISAYQTGQFGQMDTDGNLQIFSEVQAVIHPQYRHSVADMEDAMATVEEQTGVSIKFTKRRYVIAGDWQQVEAARNIMREMLETQGSSAGSNHGNQPSMMRASSSAHQMELMLDRNSDMPPRSMSFQGPGLVNGWSKAGSSAGTRTPELTKELEIRNSVAGKPTHVPDNVSNPGPVPVQQTSFKANSKSDVIPKHIVENIEKWRTEAAENEPVYSGLPEDDHEPKRKADWPDSQVADSEQMDRIRLALETKSSEVQSVETLRSESPDTVPLKPEPHAAPVEHKQQAEWQNLDSQVTESQKYGGKLDSQVTPLLNESLHEDSLHTLESRQRASTHQGSSRVEKQQLKDELSRVNSSSYPELQQKNSIRQSDAITNEAGIPKFLDSDEGTDVESGQEDGPPTLLGPDELPVGEAEKTSDRTDIPKSTSIHGDTSEDDSQPIQPHTAESKNAGEVPVQDEYGSHKSDSESDEEPAFGETILVDPMPWAYMQKVHKHHLNSLKENFEVSIRTKLDDSTQCVTAIIAPLNQEKINLNDLYVVREQFTSIYQHVLLDCAEEVCQVPPEVPQPARSHACEVTMEKYPKIVLSENPNSSGRFVFVGPERLVKEARHLFMSDIGMQQGVRTRHRRPPIPQENQDNAVLQKMLQASRIVQGPYTQHLQCAEARNLQEQTEIAMALSMQEQPVGYREEILHSGHEQRIVLKLHNLPQIATDSNTIIRVKQFIQQDDKTQGSLDYNDMPPLEPMTPDDEDSHSLYAQKDEMYRTRAAVDSFRLDSEDHESDKSIPTDKSVPDVEYYPTPLAGAGTDNIGALKEFPAANLGEMVERLHEETSENEEPISDDRIVEQGILHLSIQDRPEVDDPGHDTGPEVDAPVHKIASYKPEIDVVDSSDDEEDAPDQVATAAVGSLKLEPLDDPAGITNPPDPVSTSKAARSLADPVTTSTVSGGLSGPVTTSKASRSVTDPVTPSEASRSVTAPVTTSKASRSATDPVTTSKASRSVADPVSTAKVSKSRVVWLDEDSSDEEMDQPQNASGIAKNVPDVLEQIFTNKPKETAEKAASVSPERIYQDLEEGGEFSSKKLMNAMSEAIATSGPAINQQELRDIHTLQADDEEDEDTFKEKPKFYPKMQKDGTVIQTCSANICTNCVTPMTSSAKLECGHEFCRDCIQSPTRINDMCPECGRKVNRVTLEQPEGGKLSHIIDKNVHLPKFPKAGTIMMTFQFESCKVQGADGSISVQKAKFVTYLPNTNDGRSAFKQLLDLFKSRGLFTISHVPGTRAMVLFKDGIALSRDKASVTKEWISQLNKDLHRLLEE